MFRIVCRFVFGLLQFSIHFSQNCIRISIKETLSSATQTKSTIKVYKQTSGRSTMVKDVAKTTSIHAVAMPFPGRGHINPMMNLCKILVSKKPDILITFVVTEEWLGFIGSDPKPDNICFASIPNVVPSERLKAADFPGFYEAVMTKMEAPFEQLLDHLEPPLSVFLADVELLWAVNVGNRRKLPVASLWTMSATVFSMFYHFDLVEQHHHFPDLNVRGSELVDYIPGISPIYVSELPTRADSRVLKLAVECVLQVKKAQYLLFTSVYELEPEIMETLKKEFPFPVYSLGPTIPYLENKRHFPSTSSKNSPDYIIWLDSQPRDSVLYISLGSFLSVSNEQMDEIISGLNDSCVPYLLVARGEAPRLKESCGEKGFVVSWCDQLRVLSHLSVGGFWTHCGWNSILEGVFAGVPMLTFPIFLDQPPNSKQIVEDWKTGWRVKGLVDEGGVTRRNVTELVQKFMDVGSKEGTELRQIANQLGEVCRRAIDEGGSSERNLDGFIRDVSRGMLD